MPLSVKAFTFQCRTQHCMWCNDVTTNYVDYRYVVSMPHAALYVVQPAGDRIRCITVRVSMPHAALYVVQR